MYAQYKANSADSKMWCSSSLGFFKTSTTGGVSLFIFLMVTVALAETTASESALSYAVSDSGLEWGPCPDFYPAGCQIAVLHGDLSKPNADIFFRVPGNHDLPAHWHTSAERMVLIAGELHLTYDGVQTVVLNKPGMYVYGPPKVPHSGRCVGSQSCVLFIAFETAVDNTPASPTW